MCLKYLSKSELIAMINYYSILLKYNNDSNIQSFLNDCKKELQWKK